MLAPLLLLLLDLLALVGFVLVPGLLLVRLGAPKAEGFERAALAVAAGFAGTSILAWSVAVVTFQRVTLLHTAGAALLLSLWAARRLKKRGEAPFRRLPEGLLAVGLGGALFAGTFGVGLLNYDRAHFQYGCIHTVVQIALSDEVDLASPFADAGTPQERAEQGRRRTDPSTVQAERDEPPPWMMPLLLVGATGQRYGTTAMIAPLAAVHGFFGFRLVYALHLAILAGFLFLALERITGAPRLAALSAALSVLNPYVLKVSLLDENLMAAAWATAALYCAIRRPVAAALAGLFAGAAIGIRHIDLPLLLAVGLLLAGAGGRRTLKPFGLAAFFALLHELVHHQVAYGSLLSHEHFVDEVWFHTPYALGPWTFEYGGLLQWPFAERVIRTPYNGFPTVLLLPLAAAAHLGVLWLAAAGLGAGVTARRAEGRRLLLALALWVLPIAALLALLEDWLDPNKMGIPLTIYPAGALLFGLGLDALREGAGRRRRGVVLAGLAGLLALGVRGADRVRVPDDPAFYVKYPLVRKEVPAYAEESRRRWTRVRLLPDWSLLTQHSPLDPAGRLRGLWVELGDRDFRQGPLPRAGRAEVPGDAVLRLDLGAPLVGRTDFLRVEGGDAAGAGGVGEPGGAPEEARGAPEGARGATGGEASAAAEGEASAAAGGEASAAAEGEASGAAEGEASGAAEGEASAAAAADRAGTPGGGEALDLRAEGAAILIEGLEPGWSDRPADLLLVHDPGRRIRLFLRFGLEDFGDFDSVDGFTVDARARPGLRRLRAEGLDLRLRLPRGAAIEVVETVSLDQVLIYRWDGELDAAARLQLSEARKLFHN